MEVGFSTLTCREEITYIFVEDVIREIAAITPGRYLHIGGDEASATTSEDYDYFMDKVVQIVKKYNKTPIVWSPFDKASGTPSDAILQKWNPDSTAAFQKGMKIILSPPDKAYIDMKYYHDSPLGLSWAGLSSTQDAYEWEPLKYAPPENILGVECALWGETIKSLDDMEYLAFPRLLGHAEVGWTNPKLRNWKEYRHRLRSHDPRMQYQEIDFFKDPVVPW